MSDEPKERWTRQDAEDASRLLAEFAKRADKASGGLKRPEQIGAATISDHALPAARQPGGVIGEQSSAPSPIQKFKKSGASPAGKTDRGEWLGGTANSNHGPYLVAREGERDEGEIGGDRISSNDDSFGCERDQSRSHDIDRPPDTQEDDAVAERARNTRSGVLK